MTNPNYYGHFYFGIAMLMKIHMDFHSDPGVNLVAIPAYRLVMKFLFAEFKKKINTFIGNNFFICWNSNSFHASNFFIKKIFITNKKKKQIWKHLWFKMKFYLTIFVQLFIHNSHGLILGLCFPYYSNKNSESSYLFQNGNCGIDKTNVKLLLLILSGYYNTNHLFFFASLQSHSLPHNLSKQYSHELIKIIIINDLLKHTYVQTYHNSIFTFRPFPFVHFF